MQAVSEFLEKYFSAGIPHVRVADIIEILILTFLIYEIILWVKNTNTWALLKGGAVLAAFILLAAVFRLNTILWIVKNVFSVGLIALIVIFQPEIRRALEQMGTKKVLSGLFDNSKGNTNLFTEKTAMEIAKASAEMGKAKTGALIVIERGVGLAEYERTGIPVDAVTTSQLLINIFEHNTPLHDGAVIVRGNRIAAATCYLPLSDSRSISKDLGTRHRAGIGISEVTDSATVIVSEETGKISLAFDHKLHHGLSSEELKEELIRLCVDQERDRKKESRFWKGWLKNERKADK